MVNRFQTLFRSVADKPHRDIWLHGLFWLGYFLFEWLNTGTYRDDYHTSFFSITFHLPIILAASYWHLVVTVQHFLFSGRLVGFWSSLLVGLLVFGVFRRVINYMVLYPLYYHMVLLKPFWYWPKILAETVQLHLVVAFFVAVNLIRHAQRQQQLSETYRREKLAAEYRLLQSQVQPHFLFNTLNNLVSVSLHQPGKMPSLLLRLAELFSYQLYESNRSLVPVAKEAAYLTDYIALEQIRYSNRLEVITNFGELGSLKDLMIPPMLLLPFVENAFKHGAAQTEGPCWIQLHLSLSENRLVFTVENSLPDIQTTPVAQGLGLSNLRKRLDILFTDLYELKTLSEDGQFLAILKFSIN
jgi:two-component system LytT family sensor kinase